MTTSCATAATIIASNALQSVDKAVTVRVRDKRMSTTDGPFAETKEHLGGFILIEARDMDDAIQVGARHPAWPAGQHRGAADLRYRGSSDEDMSA